MGYPSADLPVFAGQALHPEPAAGSLTPSAREEVKILAVNGGGAKSQAECA
jgi:hypothetical protein